jgi:hypothetical protein
VTEAGVAVMDEQIAAESCCGEVVDATGAVRHVAEHNDLTCGKAGALRGGEKGGGGTIRKHPQG